MTDSEYIAEVNLLADGATSPFWARVCKYLDALVAEAYEDLAGCQSSNNQIVAGFARNFTRKRDIVNSVKGFVNDKLQEREELRRQELEEMERANLIRQLGDEIERPIQDGN